MGNKVAKNNFRHNKDSTMSAKMTGTTIFSLGRQLLDSSEARLTAHKTGFSTSHELRLVGLGPIVVTTRKRFS
jgi:hypothetical protein